MVELKCKICDALFQIPNWRESTAKFCSKKCAAENMKGDSNVICSQCGKAFHKKKYSIEKYNRTHGIFCSTACYSVARKELMKGNGNHQYGLKGNLNASFKGEEVKRRNNKLTEIKIYCPENPNCDRNGRVSKHRLIVEENYKLFPDKCFEIKNGVIVLKKVYNIHHIDHNHNNNEVSNLLPVTKSEHTKIHNENMIITRDTMGRIIGVFKQGELLENLEVDNQQPSLSSNVFEGSTTNTRIQTDNAEDGNSDTSALHQIGLNKLCLQTRFGSNSWTQR